MDPLAKPSFIPKTPLSDVSQTTTKKTSSVFSLLIILLAVGAVASYGYVRFQTQKISKLKIEYTARIEKAQREIGAAFVSDMITLQKKITSTQALLDNHVTISPIFMELQNTTVQKIQYKSFDYSIVTDSLSQQKDVVVKMNGVAPDYKTIALQTDAFSQSTFIKEPIISNLTNNDTNKTVDFILEFKVDPKDVSYDKMFEEAVEKVSTERINNRVTL
jgi:hypothetical protein